jgi:hypothetical protein
MAAQLQLKTESERLMAGYLDENGYESNYEPTILGKKKRPDFRVRRRDTECLIDAKQRSPKSVPVGARGFDPIKGVRKLIANGRDKFREFDDCLCVLVLFNNGDWDTRLSPWHVFGAMLGDPGIVAGFNATAGRVDIETVRSAFLSRGGKMIRHYEPVEVYETAANISALLIVRQISLRREQFRIDFDTEVQRKEEALGRRITDEELFEATLAIGSRLGDDPRLVTQLRVCEHPFARHRLPENIFDGPYDERWSTTDHGLQRVFAGREVSQVEADPLDSF